MVAVMTTAHEMLFQKKAHGENCTQNFFFEGGGGINFIIEWQNDHKRMYLNSFVWYHVCLLIGLRTFVMMCFIINDVS